jgi:hypothetical protein
MEFMDEYEAEFAAKDIEIVNVSIDENSLNWRSALAEYQFKGRHILSSAEQGRNIDVAFGVEAIPQYFIIDRNGVFTDKATTGQTADIRKQLLLIAGKR